MPAARGVRHAANDEEKGVFNVNLIDRIRRSVHRCPGGAYTVPPCRNFAADLHTSFHKYFETSAKNSMLNSD